MNNHSFTKLIVADLPAMTDFYTNVFGLQEAQREKGINDGEEMEEVVLLNGQPDSGVLILLQFFDGRPAVNGETILGFSTDDIAGLVERVSANRGKIRQAPFEVTHGGATMQIAVVTDPEGHVMEVVQMMAS